MTGTTTITTRDVALHLFDRGYVALTLPKREEDLTLAIVAAYEGTRIRLGDLPARSADLDDIRKHLELITREAERIGRSWECRRYRRVGVKPVGRM